MGTDSCKGVRAFAWAPFVVLLLVCGLVAGCTSPTPHTSDADAVTAAPPPHEAPSVSATRFRPQVDLIDSARWVERGGRRALAVVPSASQRESPDDVSVEEAWQQVVDRVPGADRPGMRDQYVCHARFAPAKDTYYLEPWRPAVGYLRTVTEGCNPGERKDLG